MDIGRIEITKLTSKNKHDNLNRYSANEAIASLYTPVKSTESAMASYVNKQLTSNGSHGVNGASNICFELSIVKLKLAI